MRGLLAVTLGETKRRCDVARDISPDDLRVMGEKSALYWGWAAIFVIFVIWLGVPIIDFFIIPALIIIAIAAVLIRIRQNQILGGCAKVSEKQFPAIYAIAQEAAGRLSMYQPELFIKQDPTLNAFAIGFLGSKSVVLHSATVEGMDKEELGFIVGHEFAHIKCNHTDLLLLNTGTGGISPSWLQMIATLFIGVWSRKAEYTADQGGLLVAGDPKPAIGALAKLAIGPTLFKDMDIDDFLSQKIALDQTYFTKLAESLPEVKHPYLVKRIYAVQKYYDSDQYKRLTSINE